MYLLSRDELEKKFNECSLENYSMDERIEVMAYSSNTLSGILTLLESDDQPKTQTDIFKQILRNCFGDDGQKKHRYSDIFTCGAVDYQAITLSDFELLERDVEQRFRQGFRYVPGGITVNVFTKSPLGWIFGDPSAARCLLACHQINQSPISIFTNAAKKGRTRPTTTTVKILSLLQELGVLTEKDILTYCFWIPQNRKEFSILKTRVNKNLFRIDKEGLINLEGVKQLYRYNKGRGLKPEQISPWVGYDRWKCIKGTEAITRFLYENQGESFRVTDICRRIGLDRARVSPILGYLKKIGFCICEGGVIIRSRIALTEFGEQIAREIACPIMSAARKGFSWQEFELFSNKEEYEKFWRSVPAVDRDYVLGEFRRPLEEIFDQNLYLNICKRLVGVDKNQNPWR